MKPMTPEELSRWFRDPGALDVWEDIAAWFHKETGHLRPGKDKPPGFHDTAWGESDCCMDAWVVWRSEKQDAAVAGLRVRMRELEVWQKTVANGLGYLNQPEGQDGYEVATPAEIIRDWHEAQAFQECYREALEQIAAEAVRVLVETPPGKDPVMLAPWVAGTANNALRG